MRALASILVWLWMAVVCVLIFVAVVPVFAVTAPFDRGRYWAGRMGRFMGSLAARGNPFWRFSWSGTRPRNPRKPYLVVSNHESSFDPFLLAHLPFEMKYLSKDVLFRIPFFGWAMWLVGDISINRRDKESRGRSLEKCRDVLRRRVSVMIFPEGTRSRTADLLPFRHGAFRLAIDEGVDILPLGLAGTRDALPKGTWLVNRVRAHVVIGEPISTAGLSPDDAPALAERTREIVSGLRDVARERCGQGPLPPQVVAAPRPLG